MKVNLLSKSSQKFQYSFVVPIISRGTYFPILSKIFTQFEIKLFIFFIFFLEEKFDWMYKLSSVELF